jgi:hypothetical protein
MVGVGLIALPARQGRHPALFREAPSNRSGRPAPLPASRQTAWLGDGRGGICGGAPAARRDTEWASPSVEGALEKTERAGEKALVGDD